MTNSHSKAATSPTTPSPRRQGRGGRSHKKTNQRNNQTSQGTPQTTDLPSSIKNLDRDVFEALDTSPDKSAVFLQDPLPKELEKVLKDVMQVKDSVLHLFVTNYLTTLRAIAKFGDRPIRTSLQVMILQVS